ncbi:hypothetical protein STEG23_037353, partial [Scotinomys teguina]
MMEISQLDQDVEAKVASEQDRSPRFSGTGQGLLRLASRHHSEDENEHLQQGQEQLWESREDSLEEVS